jgi:hypothetical protein
MKTRIPAIRLLRGIVFFASVFSGHNAFGNEGRHAGSGSAGVKSVPASFHGLPAANRVQPPIPPSISYANYHANRGVLEIHGLFAAGYLPGLDVNVSKIAVFCDGSQKYYLTHSADVERDGDDTHLLITLHPTDRAAVEAMFNQVGESSIEGHEYRISADAGYYRQYPDTDGSNNGNGYSVDMDKPDITVNGASFDKVTGQLTLSGWDFIDKGDGTGDINPGKIVVKGEGGGTYTLAHAMTAYLRGDEELLIPLYGVDLAMVKALFNRDGNTSTDNQTYTIDLNNGWMINGTGEYVGIPIGIDGVQAPAVNLAVYDAGTATLTLSGHDFVRSSDHGNDVIARSFTIRGEGGHTFTLAVTPNATVQLDSTLKLQLTDADLQAIGGLLNKSGTRSADGTTYNLALANGWMAGYTASASGIAGISLTVVNATPPVITGAAYDVSTGKLTVTGTDFLANPNGIDVVGYRITITGQGGPYLLDVDRPEAELTSTTSFTLTLVGYDKSVVDGLLNKNGQTGQNGVAYKLAAGAGYMNAYATASTADVGIAVSNVPGPSITNATYNVITGSLVVTGANFVRDAGNDVIASKIIITGQGGASYQLTSNTPNVEVGSYTSFTLALGSADKKAVSNLTSKGGTSSADHVIYNLNATAGFMPGSPSSSDATNGINATSVPTATSAVFNQSDKVLTVYGDNLVTDGNGDADPQKITITGEGGATYTLTTSTANLDNHWTSFMATLNTADLVQLNTILNKSGTKSTGNTTYNVSLAPNWLTYSDGLGAAMPTIGLTVQLAQPTISNASYVPTTGVLTVAGSNFRAALGDSNDIDASKFGFGNTRDVDIVSATLFRITLSPSDKVQFNANFNKAGRFDLEGSPYSLSGAQGWNRGFADGSLYFYNKPLTVGTLVTPVVTNAVYDVATGVLTVKGEGFIHASSEAPADIQSGALTINGLQGTQLGSAPEVYITSGTEFTVVLDEELRQQVANFFDKNGNSAVDGTPYTLQAPGGFLYADGNIDGGSCTLTVSNSITQPAVTGATYDWASGTLTVTGTDFVGDPNTSNDVLAGQLLINGVQFGGDSYDGVKITSSTEFTLVLGPVDKAAVNATIDNNGTSSQSANPYTLEGWIGYLEGNPSAQFSSALTVTNLFMPPAFRKATYDAATGQLTVKGTGFVADASGADVIASNIIVTDGNTIYQLTSDTRNAEITSDTTFTLTLGAVDKAGVARLVNNGSACYVKGNAGFMSASNGTIANWVTLTVVTTASTITSATYDVATGNLVVHGVNFIVDAGSDVIATKIIITGEGGATYRLTSQTSNVEITSATEFTVALGADDKKIANALINKNGAASFGSTIYNVKVQAGYMPGNNTASTDTCGITASNAETGPTMDYEVTYDKVTGVLTIPGTGFARYGDATVSDIDVTKVQLIGADSHAPYNLTTASSGSIVEIVNSNLAIITLGAVDKDKVNIWFTGNGFSDNSSMNQFGIRGVDGWMRAKPGSSNQSLTVRNAQKPSISSVIYDATAKTLTIDGGGFVHRYGGYPQLERGMISITGEGGQSVTLSSSVNTEVLSTTSAVIPLSGSDLTSVIQLLNKPGTGSLDGTVYTLSASNYWMSGFTGWNSYFSDPPITNGITVVNLVIPPVISSSAYNVSTGALTVTGTNFTANTGDDVIANKITVVAEGGVYTLVGTPNVEITDATHFTLTLTGTDKNKVDCILNKNGTTSTSGTTYHLDAAAGFIAAVAPIASYSFNTITVSNVAVPTITSATYNKTTKTLVVTGTGLVSRSGSANDIDVTRLQFDDGSTYFALTNDTYNVDITDNTHFTVVLGTADADRVDVIFNKTGTKSQTNSNYNLAGTEDWAAGANAIIVIADMTNNSISMISPVGKPVISSVVYNAGPKTLTINGANFVRKAGNANDIDMSKVSIQGEGGTGYALTTTGSVDFISSSQINVNLTGADVSVATLILNKNGTRAAGNTANDDYKITVANGWLPGYDDVNESAGSSAGTTGISVTNTNGPNVTSSATYNAATGVLVLNGVDFVSKGVIGTGNDDIDVTKIWIEGESSIGCYLNLSTSNVDVSSSSRFVITLGAADKAMVDAIVNKNGVVANSGAYYAVRGYAGYMASAPSSTFFIYLNALTASNAETAPTVSSVTYNKATGAIVIKGNGFARKGNYAIADVAVGQIKIVGVSEAGGYTLTPASTGIVEVTNATSMNFTLTGTDRENVNVMLNNNGTTSSGEDNYSIVFGSGWITTRAGATTSGMTVSGVQAPAVSSVVYDAAAKTLALTGTNFVHQAGANNDLDIGQFVITGEGSRTLALSSSASVEVLSTTSAILTLTGTDLTSANTLLNKAGNQSVDATVYNLSLGSTWMWGNGGAAAIPTRSITVSGIPDPAITGAAYNAVSGVLTVTGTNIIPKAGVANDIDVTKIAISGEMNTSPYTLTGAGVEIVNATTFVVQLSAADMAGLQPHLNNNGTTAQSQGGAVYNYYINASDLWMKGYTGAGNIQQYHRNLTVTGVANPSILSATYDATTHVVTVYGNNFHYRNGVSDDVLFNGLFTFTGEGGATKTLASTAAVDIISPVQFQFTLGVNDYTNGIQSVLNKSGLLSTGGTAYNVALADNWNAGVLDATADISAATVPLTVINVPGPEITGAAYNSVSGTLTITGTGFTSKAGAANDIAVNKLLIKGRGAAVRTLTSPDAEINSATQFVVVLNTTDKSAVNLLLDKNGAAASDGGIYNLAATEDWANGADATITIADLTGNAINVTDAVAAESKISNILVSAGTLSPSFGGTTFAYSSTVANTINSLVVTPTGVDALATITINGTVVASSAASGVIALNVGVNTVTIVSVAQNGISSSTYTLSLTRLPGTNANLSALSLGSGTLHTTFSSSIPSYTASVGNLTTTLTITPTLDDITATVTINGVAANSGSPSAPVALIAGANTINITVLAQDGTSSKTYSVIVNRALSSNTHLALLTVSTGALNPVFSAVATTFTVQAANLSSTISITPSVADATSIVTVNGLTVTSGSSSGNITLTVGNNTIPVQVFAQDGSVATYTITATRAANANANLASLTTSVGGINPSFARVTTAYTIAVGNLSGTITVTPTAAEATSVVKVNGVTVTGGLASNAITLNVGSNNINIAVTAQDGTISKTYTITATRAANANANLASLTTSVGGINPSFARATTAYTIAVGNLSGTISVTPTAAEATSVVKVNGVTVTSGVASNAIALNVGSNTINIAVTAEDGTTGKTYTITVIRAAAADPTLSSLAMSTGILTPVFSPATVSYSLAIGLNETSVTLTPTATDLTAGIQANGITLSSGQSIQLNTPGDVTDISITVTAPDGTISKTYTVTLVKPKTTWKGVITNAWNAASNWTNGLPTAGKITVIPNLANRPFITGNEMVGTIILEAGAVMSVTGTLQVTGNFTNTGSVVGPGTLVFNGTTPQTVAGSGSFNNVTLANGLTIIPGNGNTMGIAGILTLGANVTVNTNDNLLLKADSSGTASVAQVPASAHFNGNVTMQNWISGQRGYRALGHPFAVNLALNQLSDNFAVSGSGAGFVSGLGYATSSVSYYDSVAGNTSQFRKPLSNAPNTSTTEVWTANRGILALIRGKGTEGLGGTYDNVNLPSAFAMDATGALSTGTLPDYVLGANTTGTSFNLVGNPYPTPINIRLLKSNGSVALSANNTNTGVASTIYVYNPFKSAGISSTPAQEVRGGMDAYTNDGNTDIIIPPFGAFFVQAKAAGNVVKFDETAKTPGSASIRVMGVDTKAKLTLTIENKRGTWDDIKFRWDDKAGAAGNDVYDGSKLSNELLDFYSIASDLRQLCIDSRSNDMNEETIPVGISTQVADASFRIKVSSYEMPSNMQIYLRDKLMGTETLLSKVDDGYSFAITTDEATKGDKRFELAFRLAKTVATLDPLNASAEIKISPNPFKDEISIHLAPGAVSINSATKIRMLSVDGRVVKTATAAPGSSLIKINARDLANGIYFVEVSNDKVKTGKQLIKQ